MAAFGFSPYFPGNPLPILGLWPLDQPMPIKLRSYWYVGLIVAVLPAAAAIAADSIVFPSRYKSGEHYATVNRGGIREELYVSRDAITAAKAGKALPDGTVITMEDFRGGKLYRTVVMAKRSGAGRSYPANIRTGDWEFQSFKPDRSINTAEDVTRCMACHTSQASNDYVFTLDRMKSYTPGSAGAPQRQAPAGLDHSRLTTEVAAFLESK